MSAQDTIGLELSVHRLLCDIAELEAASKTDARAVVASELPLIDEARERLERLVRSMTAEWRAEAAE